MKSPALTCTPSTSESRTARVISAVTTPSTAARISWAFSAPGLRLSKTTAALRPAWMERVGTTMHLPLGETQPSARPS